MFSFAPPPPASLRPLPPRSQPGSPHPANGERTVHGKRALGRRIAHATTPARPALPPLLARASPPQPEQQQQQQQQSLPPVSPPASKPPSLSSPAPSSTRARRALAAILAAGNDPSDQPAPDPDIEPHQPLARALRAYVADADARALVRAVLRSPPFVARHVRRAAPPRAVRALFRAALARDPDPSPGAAAAAATTPPRARGPRRAGREMEAALRVALHHGYDALVTALVESDEYARRFGRARVPNLDAAEHVVLPPFSSIFPAGGAHTLDVVRARTAEVASGRAGWPSAGPRGGSLFDESDRHHGESDHDDDDDDYDDEEDDMYWVDEDEHGADDDADASQSASESEAVRNWVARQRDLAAANVPRPDEPQPWRPGWQPRARAEQWTPGWIAADRSKTYL